MNDILRKIETIVAKLWDECSIKEYRPIPFWSWNDRLMPEELKRQILWMAQEGFGGYFMHARAGLETEYLSQEWFECVRQCIRQGQTLGLDSWAYDENGWPSGFAGGKLLTEEHNHDQYLTFRIGPRDASALVSYDITGARLVRILPGEEGSGNCLNIYAHAFPSTADILNPAVVDLFLKETHEQYKKRLTDDFSGLTGFFTDEPQYFRWDTPDPSDAGCWCRCRQLSLSLKFSRNICLLSHFCKVSRENGISTGRLRCYTPMCAAYRTAIW